MILFYILGSIARIYDQQKKNTSNYLQATAHCNESKDCQVSYTFQIHKKPQEDDTKGFVEIDVIKNGTHCHQVVKKKQIRGEERMEMAIECKQTANGSATKFVDDKIAEKALAGEEFPNDMELRSRKLKNMLRNMMYEERNKDMVSNNFRGK